MGWGGGAGGAEPARAGGGTRPVQLSVTDDGPGIPAGELPLIFERLYQSGRAPARQAGSGLGLAIVSELVQAMGGRVWVESPAGVAFAGGPPGTGRGTRVVVTFRPW